MKNDEAIEDLPVKCVKRIGQGVIKCQDNVVSQMDVDAHWTKKGMDSFFG